MIESVVVTCNALTINSALVPTIDDICSLMIAVPFGNATVWFGAPVTVIV